MNTAGTDAQGTDNATIRVGMVVLTLVVTFYAVFVADVVRMDVLAVVVVLGLVLAVVNALRPWRRFGANGELFARSWQLVSATVGVGLVPLAFGWVLDVAVELFTPVMATIVVAGAYSYPRRGRLALLIWAILIWVAALALGGGVRSPSALVLHAGGLAVVAVVSMRTANARRAAAQRQHAERVRADRHQMLLASVLRANSLDPGTVLDSVVQGLVEVGFERVEVRQFNERTGHAEVLAASSGGAGRDTDRSDELVVPLTLGEGSPGIIVATSQDPLSDLHRDAVELFAEEVTAMLRRAEAFAAERRVVDESRHLDERTHDFVSTVSHELRTPLTVMQGLGQTLGRRWGDLGAQRRGDLLRRIDANIDRLEVLVLSLLNHVALDTGEFSPQIETIELRTTVESLLGRLSGVLAGHNVTVDVDRDLLVEADPSLIEHVFENLLNNAVKHTPNGTSVWIRSRMVDDAVEVEIGDDGPGIASIDLPHVLERFYRGGESTRRVSGGLGLGLALARQIVVAHGSDLDVESGPDQGASFFFRLRTSGAAT